MIGGPASMWEHIGSKLDLRDYWETAEDISKRTGIGKQSIALAMVYAVDARLVDVLPRYRAIPASYRRRELAREAPN